MQDFRLDKCLLKWSIAEEEIMRNARISVSVMCVVTSVAGVNPDFPSFA
jgi:hypothetical protein